MRRAAYALLGTTIGTALLIGAKLGHSGQAGAAADETAIVAAEETAGAGPDATADPTAPSPTPGTRTSSGPSRTTRTTTPTTVKTTTAAPKPATRSGLRSGTYTGTGYTHRYGTVKVTITVSGGVVTKASATYPTSTPTSREINESAIPKLNAAAVAAKTTANIDTVSGATLTSGAYRSSLQSALDKAGG